MGGNNRLITSFPQPISGYYCIFDKQKDSLETEAAVLEYPYVTDNMSVRINTPFQAECFAYTLNIFTNQPSRLIT